MDRGRGRGQRKRTNSAESSNSKRTPSYSRPSSGGGGGGVRKRSANDESTAGNDAKSSRNRKAGSQQPYSRNHNSAFSQRKRETNVVEISNLVNRNEQEILQTLAKHTEFTPVETLWVGNKLLITCASVREAYLVKSKTDSTLYNGQKIVVRYFHKPSDVTGSGAGQESDLITKLKQILQAKYDPVHFYLDLEHFTSAGFSQDPSKTNFGRVLCKLIGEICPDVQTISFANNGIGSLNFFSDLYRHVPRLANLSFKDNKLKTYDDLKGFNGKEFAALHELVLDGNPVKTKEIEKSGSEINFRSNVKNLFPSLRMLDGEPMMESIKFGVEESNELPSTVKQGFFDSPNTQSAVQAFLLQYYNLFDNNRAALGSFYEESSSFSISIAKNLKKDGPGSELLFKNWMPFNRSLDKITQADKRFKSIHIGFQAITNVLISLPPTKHPLQEPPEKKKFIFDAFQHGSEPNICLFIFLHGEVGVNDGSTKRSFDRTFVLIPALPGSRAAAAGLPVSIINDMLCLRPFSDNDAWSNAVPLVAHIPEVNIPLPSSSSLNLPSDPAVLAQYKVMNGLQEAQHAQVVQFAQVTGLNYAFSMQCLAESQWSNEAAFQAFNNAKPQIPPEAFRV